MEGTSAPLSGSQPFEPASIRIKVVFPVPFSPNMTTICDSTKDPAIAVSSKLPAFFKISIDLVQKKRVYLDHCWIFGSVSMLECLVVSGFGNLELKFLFTELHIFGWNKSIKENVDSLKF